MKSLTLFFLLVAFYSVTNAQEKQVKIAQQTTLEYMIYPPGQIVPATIFLEVASPDSLSMAWTVTNMNGRFRMNKQSLDSSRLGYWEPPRDGEDFLLPKEQALLCLSKAVWNELVQTNQMVYEGHKFSIKNKSGNEKYQIGDKILDAIYLETGSDNIRLWILNNAALPLILKIENNPMHIDVELTGIR